MFIILFFSYIIIHSFIHSLSFDFSLDISQLAEASLAWKFLGILLDFIVTDRNRLIHNRTVEILKEPKPLQDEFESFRNVCETWRIPSQKLKILFQKPSSTSVLYIRVFSCSHAHVPHPPRQHLRLFTVVSRGSPKLHSSDEDEARGGWQDVDSRDSIIRSVHSVHSVRLL